MPIHKKCNYCNKDFLAKRSNTKYCSKKCGMSGWRQDNPDYWERYKERGAELARKNYLKNRKRILDKIKTPEYRKKQNELNKLPSRKKYHREYVKNKRKIDPIYRLRLTIRDRIKILNIKKPNKGKKVENILYYSLDDLLEHLIKTIPNNFTVKDYLNGELELDHIIPLSLFYFFSTDDDEFKKCWAIKNLRLIPKLDNKKRLKSKITWDDIIKFDLESILPLGPIDIFKKIKNNEIII